MFFVRCPEKLPPPADASRCPVLRVKICFPAEMDLYSVPITSSWMEYTWQGSPQVYFLSFLHSWDWRPLSRSPAAAAASENANFCKILIKGPRGVVCATDLIFFSQQFFLDNHIKSNEIFHLKLVCHNKILKVKFALFHL